MTLFTRRVQLISIGMAMFSMFFGAGNVVFPLILGQIVEDKSLTALIGLLITAVGVPFLGLFAMTLFNGDYRSFFARLGKPVGFAIEVIIMGLIGPFGGIPRCVTLSYSTMKMTFPDISIIPFSIVSCLIIYLFTAKKNRVVPILGYVLTPILLISLLVIIIKGMLIHPELKSTYNETTFSTLVLGLKFGYQTMDLLGAFFFCAVVIEALKEISMKKELISNTLLSSIVGATLLAVIYIGLAIVASLHSSNLSEISGDMLLGTIALQVIGPYAGIVTGVSVVLACLTTAIALTCVFAEFLHNDIFQDKINYHYSLLLTTILLFFFSTLEFHGITAFLGPIIQMIYPSLIVLCLVNIAYKLWGFSYVKIPVGVTFIISLVQKIF